MADTDLIAWVYPYEDQRDRYAQLAIESAPSRCMPPKVALQEPPRGGHRRRSSRESTEPPEISSDDTLPFLELRFSNVPRKASGLMFGTDPNCDIVLPKIRGISKRHFALTYKDQSDGHYRLIVRDRSTYGTVVTYDGEGGHLRNNFDWIIGGCKVTNDIDKIIVQPHEHVKFRIIVARHDITSPAYIDNVERFRQGGTGAEDLLGGLGLQSGPQTEGNTGAHTPTNRPILLPRGRIAKGEFGVVSHHWNVSTGEEYACKQPAHARYNGTAWEKEIEIMKKISHPNIVRLCFSETTPAPLLALEYMPFGNLEDEHRRVPFTDDECVQILHQSLSALVYLHGQPEPVAHRDIKPENILVKYRDPDCNPDHLHIKLSDFGLSKAGSLKTWCGTPSYLAPEVQDEDTPQRKYTTAVDIWSLGVVILRLAYELPYPGSGNGAWWCERIAEEANGWESEGLIDVVQRMLVVDPKGRCSAEAGFQDTSQLLASAQDRSATPTPASGAPGYSPAANSDLTSSSIDEEALYEIWRNLESDAPPPEATKETAATTKKRTARTSKTSSASSSRRNTKRHMSTTVPHPESVGYPEESAVYVGPQTTSEWSSLAADEYSDAADQQAPAVVAVGATETTPSLRSDFLAGDTAAYVPPQTDAYSQYTESNGSNGSYLAPAGKSYEELLA